MREHEVPDPRAPRPRTRCCCGSPSADRGGGGGMRREPTASTATSPSDLPSFAWAIAVLFGILGIAPDGWARWAGRGLPLVAADLLKFNLGARFYVGSLGQLARSEAPPVPEAKPDPLRLLAKKAAAGIGKAVKAARNKGRAPFRPHSWFGKRRNGPGERRTPTAISPPHPGRCPETQAVRSLGSSCQWPWPESAASLAVVTLVLRPNVALADDPDDEAEDKPYGDAWRLDEVYFEPPEPVPGRRIFIERLAVTGDTATGFGLRAAHDLDLKVRVFGGRTGRRP